MEKVELINLIKNLDVEDEKVSDAYFGIFSDYDRGEYQQSWIEANKRGFYEFIARLVVKLSEFDSKERTNTDFVNDIWYDPNSNVTPFYIDRLNKTKQEVLEEKGKIEKPSWRDKYIGISLAILFFGTLLAGIIQILTWLYKLIF